MNNGLSLEVVQLAQKFPAFFGTRRYFAVLYIHVTVHRNKFLFNDQPDALVIQIYSVIKFYMLWASCLSIIGSSIQYIRHW